MDKNSALRIALILLLTPCAASAQFLAPIYQSNRLTDSFSGASTTLLSAHTSDSANTWAQTFTSGGTETAQLNGSNGVIASAAGSAAYLSNWTPLSANYAVQLTCNVATDGVCALYARATAGSTANGYELAFTAGTGVQFGKQINGSFTQIGSTYSGVINGSHVLTLICSGTSFTALVDGTSRITGTDTKYTSAGLVGLTVYYSSGSAVASALIAH